MNLNQKFLTLFWLKKDKINKQGFAPIWMRITIDGNRSEFATQKKVPPKFWNAEANIVNKQFPDSQSINEYLILLKNEITRRYNVLLTTKENVTANDVRDSFKGTSSVKKTLFQVFAQFCDHLSQRKAINDLSEIRQQRFEMLQRRLKEFVRFKFKRNDLFLDEVKLPLAVELNHYLRINEKLSHNTAMKDLKDVKQVMRYAVMLEYIPSSPLDHFRCSYKKVKREFLNQEELDILYMKAIKSQRLSEVRDCYLFCCYTGYGYADAEALSIEDVVLGIDGGYWIIRDRIKTNTTENVPLLPIPLEIINKYRKHPYCKMNNRLLPMNSNQKYNAYLKEVAEICGIKKTLTSHTARHTFATTITLSNDVPMETVMELLGHTDIRTTQIYGKIIQKKISSDMLKLKDRLADKSKS